MQRAVFSLIVAFIGYSLLNITQAGQKIGLARRAKSVAKGWTIWVLATIGTSAAFFVILGAISLGSVSLVGAMAGTGLASLAVFSHFIMRERLDRREIAAIAGIIGGAAIVAIFAEDSPPGETHIRLLWAILGGGVLLYALTWVSFRRRAFVGAVIGGFSGFLGAYSQLFQEHGTSTVSIANGLWPFVVSVVTNPITLVWVALSVASMIVLQFAYRHGRAIEIIPTFTGNFIVVPVVGGVLIFSQHLTLIQWLGVAVIVVGAAVLGSGQDNTEVADRGQAGRTAP